MANGFIAAVALYTFVLFLANRVGYVQFGKKEEVKVPSKRAVPDKADRKDKELD